MERRLLSESAKRFLVQTIASVERLDILLLAHRTPDRWWTAQALSEELLTRSESVESHLDALGAQNLLSVRIAQEVLYRFSAGTSELQRLVDEIAEAHYFDRGAVVTFVAPPSVESMRLFAEAFRFRKGKQDG